MTTVCNRTAVASLLSRGARPLISGKTLLIWGAAFAITLLAFYAMDLLMMGAQGLPLRLDLTPAQ